MHYPLKLVLATQDALEVIYSRISWILMLTNLWLFGDEQTFDI